MGEHRIPVARVYRCGASSPAWVFGAGVLTERTTASSRIKVPWLWLRLVGVVAGADEGPVEYSLLARWWPGSPAFHGDADSSCREKGGLVCGRLWLVGEGSGHLLRGELASSSDLKQERLGEHPQQGDRIRPIYFWDLDPVSFELVAAAVRQRQFGKGLLLLQACGRSEVFSGAGCSSTAEKWAPCVHNVDGSLPSLLCNTLCAWGFHVFRLRMVLPVSFVSLCINTCIGLFCNVFLLV